MSVRKKAEKRLLLSRCCGTCGRQFQTTAATPWVRQVPRDGKRQATTYYCSSACFQASYKHIGWYDGKADERRKAREGSRDVSAKNRKYYAAHIEQERRRARERYWANPEAARADMAYQRKKRRAMGVAV